jgi:hypothetical protein
MLSIKPFETVYLVEAVALDDSTAIKRGFIPLRKMQDCLSITTHVGASLDAPLHRYSICTDTMSAFIVELMSRIAIDVEMGILDHDS